MPVDATELRRLKWHCRRGLLELDVLFENFLEQRYTALTPEDQKAFSALLACADQDLLYWLLGDDLPPVELQRIVSLVRGGV